MSVNTTVARKRSAARRRPSAGDELLHLGEHRVLVAEVGRYRVAGQLAVLSAGDLVGEVVRRSGHVQLRLVPVQHERRRLHECQERAHVHPRNDPERALTIVSNG